MQKLTREQMAEALKRRLADGKLQKLADAKRRPPGDKTGKPYDGEAILAQSTRTADRRAASLHRATRSLFGDEEV